MATRDYSNTLTLPQARARLATAALRQFTKEQLIQNLGRRGYSFGEHDPTRFTARQLAYKLAWWLLPAHVSRVASIQRHITHPEGS